MNNYLKTLTLVAISCCLICGGCQSEKAADTGPAAVQPPEKEAEPVKTVDESAKT